MGQWGAFETLPTALLPCPPPPSPAGSAPSSPSFPKDGSWSAVPTQGLQGAKRAGICLLPKCPCVLCVSSLSVQSKSDFPWFFVKALSNLTLILPKIPPSPCQNPDFKLWKSTPGHPFFYSKAAEQELCFKGHVLKKPQFIYCCGSLAFSWHPTLHQLCPWKTLDMVCLFRHLKQIKFSSQRITIPSLFSCRINELHKTRI